MNEQRLQLTHEPWEVTIITAPAPNAGAVRQNEPHNDANIEATFRRRIDAVLSGAIAFDQTALVLGAWGCGVFQNDPLMVARLFASALKAAPFSSAFAHVTFAVLDREGPTLAAFAQHFG